MLEKRLYEQILGIALSGGADFAEVYCEYTRTGRIALMNEGDILQYAAPKDIFYHPISREVADYFGIGQKKIRKIVDENPTAEFVLKNGAFTKIKRGKFERFLDQTSCI